MVANDEILKALTEGSDQELKKAIGDPRIKVSVIQMQNLGLTRHTDPRCAIFVRDFFRWSVFGIMTKLMGSPKTHGVTGHVGIREF